MARYGSIFRDDYSGAIFFYSLAHKSDVLANIRDIAKIARSKHHKFITLRTDNDTVYGSKAASSLYDQLSMVHQVSVPYTPQQNGAAERAVRTVSEAGNALQQQAKLDLDFRSVDKRLWPDACSTAAYVLNRTRHQGSTLTPYELLTGQQPDLSHLRVFGSPAYVHIPRQLRDGKFGAHRRLAIFVGYPKDAKAWLFFDESSATYFSARDASFLEVARVESVAIEVPLGEPEYTEADALVPPLPDRPGAGPAPDARAEASPTVSEGQTPSGSVDYDSASSAPAKSTSISTPSRAENPDTSSAPRFLIRIPAGHNNLLRGIPPTTPTSIRQSRDVQALQRGFIQPGPATSLPDLSVSGRSLRPRANVVPDLNAYALYACAFATHPQVKTPTSYREAVSSPEASNWTEACDSEISSLERNGTYEICSLPSGRQAIDTKWVFALKLTQAGTIDRYKARVVARGFRQVEGIDYFETFSPVASYPTIRTFLSIAAAREWEIQQCDAVTAFLNAPLDEEIYVKPPEGYEGDGQVWRLRKALYELKQAGRQ